MLIGEKKAKTNFSLMIILILLIIQFLSDEETNFLSLLFLIFSISLHFYFVETILDKGYIFGIWVLSDVIYLFLQVKTNLNLTNNCFYLFLFHTLNKEKTKTMDYSCNYLKNFHFLLKIILSLTLNFSKTFKFIPELIFQDLLLKTYISESKKDINKYEIISTSQFSLNSVRSLNRSNEKFKSEILENFLNGIIVIENSSLSPLSNLENIEDFNLSYYNKEASQILGFETKTDLKESLNEFKTFESETSVSISLNSTQSSKNSQSLLNDMMKNRKYHNFIQKYISEEKKMLIVKFLDISSKTMNKEYRIISIDNMEEEREKLVSLLFGSLKSKILLTISHELNNPLNGLIHKTNEFIEIESDFEKKKESAQKMKFLVFLIKSFLKNFSLFLRFIYKEKLKNESNYLSFHHHFEKIHKKFIPIFDEKRIKITLENNDNRIKDLIIYYDWTNFKNLIQNIYMYMYYRLTTDSQLSIEFKCIEESKKFHFLCKKVRSNKKTLISNIVENDSFEKEISTSIQTIEMLKEIIENLCALMHIKLLFGQNSDNDNEMQDQTKLLISLEFEYSHFEEADDSDLLTELSPHGSTNKANNLYQIARTVKKFQRNDNFRFRSQVNKAPNIMNLTLVKKQIKRIISLRNENESRAPCLDKLKIDDCEDTLNNSNSLNFSKNFNMRMSNSSITDMNNLNCLINKKSENKLGGIYLETIHSENNSVSNSPREEKKHEKLFKTEYKEKIEKEGFIHFCNDRLIEPEEVANSSSDDSKIKDDDEDEYFGNKKYFGGTEKQSRWKKTKFNTSNYYFSDSQRTINHNSMKIQRKISFSQKNMVILKKSTLMRCSEGFKITNNSGIFSRRSVSIKHSVTRIENICLQCKDFLVVDDENFNISSIKFLLRNLKIDCDSCNDGQECIDKIKQSQTKNCCRVNYKVILLDLMMPIMGGYETCLVIQKMLSEGVMKKAPNVIVVSAHNQNEIIERVMKFSFVREYVAKPIKKSKIDEIVRKYYQ